MDSKSTKKARTRKAHGKTKTTVLDVAVPQNPDQMREIFVPRSNRKRKYAQQFMPQQYEGETNFMPSETVPDMSMSLSELVERARHGMPIPPQKSYDEGWFGEEHIPNFNDKAEHQQWLKTMKDKFSELKSELSEQKKEKLAELQKEYDSLRETSFSQLEELEKLRALQKINSTQDTTNPPKDA